MYNTSSNKRGEVAYATETQTQQYIVPVIFILHIFSDLPNVTYTALQVYYTWHSRTR